MSLPRTYTQRLAAFAAQIAYNDAPADVQERVRCCLLYNLAMGVLGYAPVDADPIGRALRAVAAAPGVSTVLVSGERLSAADAAFVNAALVTARGQNDTHPAVVTHIGCVVIPAVLAVAQECEAGADRVLSAILAGYETVPKIACGAAAESTARGFRPTSLYSVIGAAVAVARVLELDEDRIACAIGIATNLAGGITQCWAQGSSEWRLQIAQASRCGVVAALLAERGFDAASEALEGSKGFYRAFSGAVPQLELSGWDIRDVTFKLYPGCAFNQSPVHALRLLLAESGAVAADIERLVVSMNPEDLGYPGVDAYGPFESPGGAIMSCAFMLAATLRDGVPSSNHFEQEYGSGSLHADSRRVHLEPDAALGRWTCRIRIESRDGSAAQIVFDEARPFVLDWSQTAQLMQSVARGAPLPAAQQRLLALQRLLEGPRERLDAAALMELCVDAPRLL